MISLEEAQALVERELARRGPLPDGDVLVLLPQLTQEHDFGWVFFYNSRRFIETGDFGATLLGNGPLLVDRRTGAVEAVATAYSVETYLAMREARPRRIVISGWRPGFRKVSHTQLLRERAGLSLVQAYGVTCRVTEGEAVTLEAVANAPELVRALEALGAVARVED